MQPQPAILLLNLTLEQPLWYSLHVVLCSSMHVETSIYAHGLFPVWKSSWIKHCSEGQRATENVYMPNTMLYQGWQHSTLVKTLHQEGLKSLVLWCPRWVCGKVFRIGLVRQTGLKNIWKYWKWTQTVSVEINTVIINSILLDLLVDTWVNRGAELWAPSCSELYQTGYRLKLQLKGQQC